MSNQIREVKEATDIVQIIGEKLTLQRAGRNLKALCPFHSEKSPSFFVTPDIQTYRCFGCGEHGDVFTFLQKYDGLTFAESLKVLADRAGIKLQQANFSHEDDQRARLFEILQLTRDFYHFLLTKHAVGEPGREYLQQRGMHADTTKEFFLGFAPDRWDTLIRYLVGKKKFSILDLEAAGLVILKNSAPKGSQQLNDYYDRFRGRLMFPLTDHRGRVVGFSGRTLIKDAKEAKYINSPETLLYHKSQLLYGYSQLYRSIREAGQVVVVEGEFDVLSSTQAHVRNIVAIKGSALTKEHVARLKQAVDTVILSLDADSAGVEATKRAIEIVKAYDVRLKVLPMHTLGGKDPDDIAREQPKAWREHVKSAVSAYQYLIDAAFLAHDQHSAEGKQAIVKEVAGVLMSIPHAVERAHYMGAVASRLQVSESVLQQDIVQYQKTASLSSRRGGEAQNQPVIDDEKRWSPIERLERHVLHVLLNFPEQQILDKAQRIQLAEIQHTGIRRIIEHLQQWSGNFSIAACAQALDPELHELLSQAYLEAEPSEESTEKDYLDSLKRHQHAISIEQMKVLTVRLEYLDAIEEKTAQQEEEYTQLLKEVVELQSRTVQY